MSLTLVCGNAVHSASTLLLSVEATEQFRFAGLKNYGWLQKVTDILAASNGQMKQRDKDGEERQKGK